MMVGILGAAFLGLIVAPLTASASLRIETGEWPPPPWTWFTDPRQHKEPSG